MKYPVGRLVLIAVIAGLWLILAVIGLRSLGMSDNFQAYDHPLVKEDYWLIAWGGDETNAKAMTKTAFLNAEKLHPDLILGAAVQSLEDGTLVIADKHFSYDGEEVVFLRRLTYEEWKSSNPDGLTLTEFVTEFSDRSLYLNLDRLNLMNHASLFKSLEPLHEKRQVLIKSSPQGIKKKLKEKQPWWLFSNTTAEIGKFKLMQALFLEPVASLNADFFVDKSFAPRLITEIHRRYKKAIYEPKADETEVLVKARGYDGLVTTKPSDFISLVD